MTIKEPLRDPHCIGESLSELFYWHVEEYPSTTLIADTQYKVQQLAAIVFPQTVKLVPRLVESFK